MNYLTTHNQRESSYLLAYKAPLHLSRTLYKSALFMQNKPNSGKAQINVNIYYIKDYQILSRWPDIKTNPIQTQSNPVLSAVSLP